MIVNQRGAGSNKEFLQTVQIDDSRIQISNNYWKNRKSSLVPFSHLEMRATKVDNILDFFKIVQMVYSAFILPML